ncbi:large subunit ribosomal protein L25 [Virgibacillus halotolerans]|uniref:50S ribosomal protein L25/general stress protein Ctc n=1 Tax=Virgibacillus halotolerans TaxID=1071053 RepID=UPI0019611FFC|nr:50S ribosomal protein L25/general stress protein Ctc [Virgibacillus halotolerans]MBM7601297.1 large subunit ribosomal protein L25 [Virgibacillus halotolerans]
MALDLKAAKREDFKHSTTKQLRQEGLVPAVVYGQDKGPKHASVVSIDLLKMVRDEGRNAIISLNIDGDKPVDVMLHDYQMDPIKNELVHVDFYIVNMSEEMDVEVSLRLEGEAQGSKDGGVLQQPLYELQVRAKPNNIPDEITVDVAALEIGDSITIGDLPVSDKYEFLEETDTTIATVLQPDVLSEEDEAGDADASAEPELVGADEEEEK